MEMLQQNADELNSAVSLSTYAHNTVNLISLACSQNFLTCTKRSANRYTTQLLP